MENGSFNNDTQQPIEAENGSTIREDDRKLFVGGLSWDTYEKDLKEYFTKFGEVENVNLKKDPYTQKSRGFAFVLFTSQDSLDKILNGSGHVIKGKRIDPKRAKARTGKIFVGGLNAEMSDDDIKNHFGKFGKVIEVEMPFDKQKNQRKGFCFITYEHEEVMKEVLNEPKQSICGKQVDVKKATPRPDNGLFGMLPRGRGRGMRGAFRGRGRGWQCGWDQYGGYGYDYGYGYDGYGGYGYNDYYPGGYGEQ